MISLTHRLFAILAIGLLLLVSQAESGQTMSTNPNTGAETWKSQAHGVTFSLTQLLTEQLRAFFVNRGFSLEQIEPYAQACVFTAVLRNDKAPGVVHFLRKNWSIEANMNSKPPLATGSWLQRLQQAGAKKPALIAFRWAQFPPEHEYEPNGDWNQGMLATGLAAGSEFDLVVRWDVDGKPYEMTLQGVRCVE